MGHFVLEAFVEGTRHSAVFRATRVIGSGPRLAAVKLLRTGSPEPGLTRLFDEERRSLASLDHPAIPRLLGSGITADGWSWFAMEHVLGWPLMRYADDENLDLAERVRLMIQVCRAVAHAHERKVLHPDLHPASLMVTTTGEPRVIGFGLPGLPTGRNLEQLGDLVFEAVQPARPFLAELRGSAGSDRPEDDEGVLARLPRPRSDVDRVFLKAVGHGRMERYESVGALADDLERLLEGRPVAARSVGLLARIRDAVDRAIGAGLLRPAPTGSPSPSGRR